MSVVCASLVMELCVRVYVDEVGFYSTGKGDYVDVD